MTDNQTLVQRFYEVLNTGHTDLLDQILSSDCAGSPLAPEQAPGRSKKSP